MDCLVCLMTVGKLIPSRISHVHVLWWIPYGQLCRIIFKVINGAQREDGCYERVCTSSNKYVFAAVNVVDESM